MKWFHGGMLILLSGCLTVTGKPKVNRGVVLFEIIGEENDTYEICGSWNNWQKKPLKKLGRYHYTEIPLPKGTYEFIFYQNRAKTFLPEGIQDRVPDGFGGENGLLVVP